MIALEILWQQNAQKMCMLQYQAGIDSFAGEYPIAGSNKRQGAATVHLFPQGMRGSLVP